MPGWRVWVDGEAARLERANAIFIGTEVPPGTHRVEFRFLPTSAVLGVGLTGLTVFFLSFLFLVAGRAPEGEGSRGSRHAEPRTRGPLRPLSFLAEEFGCKTSRKA